MTVKPRPYVYVMETAGSSLARRIAAIAVSLGICMALEIPVTLAIFAYQLSRACACDGPDVDATLAAVGIEPAIAAAILYAIAPALYIVWSLRKHKSPPTEGGLQ